MVPGEETILRQIPVRGISISLSYTQRENAPIEERQQLGRARGVAPVAHELERDGEHGENVDASGAHAVVSVLGGLDVERARSIAVREDTISGIPQGEGEERRADLNDGC